MTIKDIYTKDNTILTPSGQEYINLDYALKAYNVTMEEFNMRLDKAKSIRELFCGLDYPCGLKYDLDGTVHDFTGMKHKSLEDMCKYYHADIKLFESLYELGVDLQTCLVQPPYVKVDNYIENLRKEVEEKKFIEQQELERLEKEKQDKDEELQEIRKRLKKAKLVLEQYYQIHVLKDKPFTRERAVQIEQLGSLIRSHRTFNSNERRLVNRAKIALECKTALISNVPDSNREVIKSILGDIRYKYIDTSKVRISENVKLKEIVNSVIREKSELEKPFVTKNVNIKEKASSDVSISKESKIIQPLDLKSIIAAKREKENATNLSDKIEKNISLEDALKSKDLYKSDDKDVQTQISDKEVTFKRTNKNMNYNEIQLETIRILKAYLGQ